MKWTCIYCFRGFWSGTVARMCNSTDLSPDKLRHVPNKHMHGHILHHYNMWIHWYFMCVQIFFMDVLASTCISKLQHNSFLLGTLNFVTLYSLTTLPHSDDVFSPPISIGEGFPFGTGTVYSVYVRKHFHCAYIYVAVCHLHCYAELCY